MKKFLKTSFGALVATSAFVVLGACSTPLSVAETTTDKMSKQSSDDRGVVDLVQEVPSPGPAIWKMKDEDTTVYLFGTVHLLQKETEWMTDTIETAWNESGTVYFETDVSPEGEQAIAPFVMQTGFNKPGTTLSSFFTPEQVAEMNEYTQSIGIPFAGLEGMRPWLANLMVSVTALTASGADPEAGGEAILYAKALETEKEVRRFEELEEQIGFFANMDDAKSAEYMVQTIKDMKENPEIFNELVALWQTGDAEGLATMMNEGFESAPELFDVLLTNRNARWVTELTRLMGEEEGTFFVAVGAGHLSGPTSVTKMLRDGGFTVIRQ